MKLVRDFMKIRRIFAGSGGYGEGAGCAVATPWVIKNFFLESNRIKKVFFDRLSLMQA